MKTTVEEYTTKHPKTILAKKLMQENITGVIYISSGIIAPNNKQSKLYREMQRDEAKGYIIGGRAGKNANDGYFFAVYTC